MVLTFVLTQLLTIFLKLGTVGVEEEGGITCDLLEVTQICAPI